MDELIKALTTLAKTATAYLEGQMGQTELPKAVTAPVEPDKAQTWDEPVAVKKVETRGRKKKEKIAEITDENIFDPVAEAAETPQTTPPEETKRRVREVMGLFIRRHLRSTPPGLDRAQAILIKTVGQVKKLDDLTYEDNVRLIPIFERELANGA